MKEHKKGKIFVTGLCGDLGRAIAREGTDAGWEIVGINRSPWPDRFPMPDGVTLHRMSLDDPSQYAPLLEGCDVVIHCAAMHLLNGAGRPLGDFIQANVANTANLLECGRAAGIRSFVLCSSMTVVIGEKLHPNGIGVFDESATVTPNGHYSMSKVLMERLALEYARMHDISVCCLRHLAFGQGKSMDEINFGLIGLWLSERDAARACLLAAEQDGLRGDCFQIGSGSPLTHADIQEALGNPWEVLERLYPGCRAVLEPLGFSPKPSHFHPVVCNKKSRRVLGYEPLDTFEAWLRSKGWTPQELKP